MAVDPTIRTERFPCGIVGVEMGEVERQISGDEPPALAPNAALTVIGKSVPRQNGRAKVTGATRFTVDIALPGMLHGRILRSSRPHAEIRALDSAAAARYPGVRAIIPIVTPGDPATATVRYIGAPIAAVAAVSMAAADRSCFATASACATWTPESLFQRSVVPILNP
jgi:xanthine dehydrogenase YagR molybdenum-binding subunit